ncbi:MAG: NCS1 family nucleobase:cation symporter-1 [Candidatus Sumerlaeaceae bacterium]
MIQEVTYTLNTSSSLYNADLAPVPAHRRTWRMWSIAALWVGMAVCIPTYTLAAGMISQGMNWWQALLTVTLGNLIVTVPMILNAEPGTRYGIPFPVLLRASFGTRGANIPAIMRAIVACGWFGIQTWIGGSAIYTLLSVILKFPVATAADHITFLGASAGQFGCFLLFWAINMLIVITGTHGIKWLENLSAPFLLAVGLALLAWGVTRGGGFGNILSDATIQKLRGKEAADFNIWKVFWPNLTAMVGFWATLSLNIPDFSRYAKSQKDQVYGQLMGLPTTMALYSFIGIAVTCATVVVFGKAIWDPVELLGKFEQPLLIGFALFSLMIATLTTNIAANVVSPANDFSNLSPRNISFKMGGIITGVIGILIMPWKLYSDLSQYIFTWLIGYGVFLGAIAGVMLADYYLVRKRVLNVTDLFEENGEYSFGGSGFNWRAFVALIVGVVPAVPGFVHAATSGSRFAVTVSERWQTIYTYGWFVSLGIAVLTYVVLCTLAPMNASQTATIRTRTSEDI